MLRVPPYPPRINNCRLFLPALHAQKHRLNQFFSPITKSTTWRSVWAVVFNTKNLNSPTLRAPQQYTHSKTGVAYASSADGTTGMTLGLVFPVAFSFRLQSHLALQGKGHEQAVSWVANGPFCFTQLISWELRKSFLFVWCSATYARPLAHWYQNS
jgi:hypothetical protein